MGSKIEIDTGAAVVNEKLFKKICRGKQSLNLKISDSKQRTYTEVLLLGEVKMPVVNSTRKHMPTVQIVLGESPNFLGNNLMPHWQKTFKCREACSALSQICRCV